MPHTLIADPPNWTDKLSAWSSVLASVFALIAIGITVWFAVRDRRRSEALRREDLAAAAQAATEADQRLREEREAADRRLIAERADWDRRQVRDWQAAATLSLLERIARLEPFINHLSTWQNPNLDMGATGSEARKAALAAIDHLQQGAYSDALALGSEQGATLYRELVALVVSVQPTLDGFARQDPQPAVSEAARLCSLHVRRYSRYVRLWLCQLIDEGQIPERAVRPFPPTVDAPVLGGTLSGMVWTPVEVPVGWWEDTRTDPDDPAFTPHN